MGESLTDRPTAAVVGMFDGVHLGHRHLLRQLTELAHERGLAPLAVTFPGHPLSCICPERAPRLLSLPDEKLQLLKGEGVEVAMLPFTPELRATSAAGFLTMLRESYGAQAMLLGFNNRFGHDAPSDFSSYAALGREHGVELFLGSEFDLEGKVVSSSAIRRSLSEGDAEGAAAMLGRFYPVTGTVVAGKRLGRQLGFPTANLEPYGEDKLIPAPGVYAAEALLPSGLTLPAVVNIGRCPTVESVAGATPRQTIEAHIIGYEGDLYGQPLTLTFIRRLRSERRFPDLDSLRSQIGADIALARSVTCRL